MRSLLRPDTSSELRRRLARLGLVFELQPIADQAMGAAEAAEYYKLCFGAYRRRHSPEGAVHMALNEGRRFDPAGFSGQLQRLLALWAGRPTADVLEIGFGHGYNLAWMAERLPATHFEGLDLTPRHVKHVAGMLRERGLANVHTRQGDFHAQPFADASFDHAWAIEAFCYATDTPRALAEAARVLRPGGSFTLYDGYLTRPSATMTADEQLAVCLGAKGMAMPGMQVADELIAQAEAGGFELERRVTLDKMIVPSVKRLEGLMGLFVRWPWLARRLLARLNPVAMRNVLSGYLASPTLELGLWTYLEIVLRKRA